MDDGENTFYSNFVDVLSDCEDKVKLKQSEYGDSWKTCDTNFLRRKLGEEIQEYKDTRSDELEYKELIDIINVCLMLAKRNKLMDVAKK